VCDKVHDQVAGPQGGAVTVAAAGQGSQPSRQLGEVERLDQVVVGAGVKAGDPVGDGVPGGQDA
jgi:hypothetical protein